MSAPHDDRTLGELVAGISDDVRTLIRGQIELAKAELRESAREAATGSALFGAAGFLAVVAFLLLSVAAAFGLTALGLHPAVAFLVVAVLYLLIAALFAAVGKRRFDRAGSDRTQRNLVATRQVLTRRPSGTSPE